MNILVVDTNIIEQKIIEVCSKSKYLTRLYTASPKPLCHIPNVEYNDYEDLVKKAKGLQIDLILLANKIHIQNGLVEILNKNKLNVIAVNKKWFNLEQSRLIAKKLLEYYFFNTPNIIKAPIFFPLVVKSDKPKICKIVYTMQELISVRESFSGETLFLEEYIEGKCFRFLSLWDGSSLIHFIREAELTEVQVDRLEFLKTKLNFMFADEKPDFIGFFSTKIIWFMNDWYILDFVMHLNEKSDIELIKPDFLYLLNAVIYQKLSEIEL